MNTLNKELIQFRAMPDNKMVKIKVGILRGELSLKTQYQAVATAGVSLLAWFAANTQISFEERKNIDRILFSMQNAPTQNEVQRLESLNELYLMTTHYTK